MVPCRTAIPTPPLPLLITGVAGVAGYNALHYFQAKYPGQVIGIRQSDNWPLAGPGIEACDAEDHHTLRQLFDRYQFRSVLNCAGNCALRSCELDSRLAWRTNVEGLLNLLTMVSEEPIRFCTSLDRLGFFWSKSRYLCPWPPGN